MTVRDAQPGELAGTAERAEKKVVVDDGGTIVAYACASIINQGGEMQAWIHDAWADEGADEYALVKCLTAVRRWIREQGHDVFYANVFVDSPMLGVLAGKMYPYQIVFRSKKWQ